MDKNDLFKRMLLEQQAALIELIAQAKMDHGRYGEWIGVVLASEKRMVDNFILLVDLLPN